MNNINLTYNGEEIGTLTLNDDFDVSELEKKGFVPIIEDDEIISFELKKVVVRNYKNPIDEDIADIIEAFRPINSMVNNFYKRKVERDSIIDLLKNNKKGYLIDLIKNKIPVTNQEKYSPRITKPSALANKLGDLEAFIEKNGKLFNLKTPDENLSERDYHEKYLAYDEETGQKYTYGNATEDEVSPEELKAYKEKLANHEKYLKESKGKSPKPINFEEFKADFKKPTGKITKKEDLYLVPCPE